MTPKISVITATYNRSEVLRWAVSCVLAQTFQDWELIVVGDACTDDTAALMAGFEDPRIRFVNLPENFGEQSGPNNHGLGLARGEWIAYLNHDDLWFADHLETLLGRMQAEAADLIYALPIQIDVKGLVFCGLVNAELRYDPSHFVPASLWLMRRKLAEELGGWRASRDTYARNPSQEFLFRAWQRTSKLCCSPRVTALLLASGGRPQSYARRDDSQHRELYGRLSEPNFREHLMTMAAIRYAERDHAMQHAGARAVFRRFLSKALLMLGCNPDAAWNWLAGRKRGFRIDELRALRGLPQKPREEKHG